jgi:hypothetical protein
VPATAALKGRLGLRLKERFMRRRIARPFGNTVSPTRIVSLLFAVALLAVTDTSLSAKLAEFRRKQTEAILKAAPLKL